MPYYWTLPLHGQTLIEPIWPAQPTPSFMCAWPHEEKPSDAVPAAPAFEAIPAQNFNATEGLCARFFVINFSFEHAIFLSHPCSNSTSSPPLQSITSPCPTRGEEGELPRECHSLIWPWFWSELCQKSITNCWWTIPFNEVKWRWNNDEVMC
jgi:hypothetical protein